MKRWILPLATIGATLALLGVCTLIPAGAPPAGNTPVSNARVSRVCPYLSAESVDWRIVAASKDGQLAAAALDARPNAAPTSLLKEKGSAQPLRISAPRNDQFDGTGWVSQADGSERGLSSIACASPNQSAWFVGALLSVDATAELTLFNADATDAIVDIAIFDENGRVAAPGARGIVVRALSSHVVPLSAMSTASSPIAKTAFSIHVETSTGRVAPILRQRLWKANDPLSAEWLPPTGDPSPQVIMPGVPAGDGARKVSIVNPGDRTAQVTVELLGVEGTSVIPETQEIEVPPASTKTFDLTDTLAGQPGAIRLDAGSVEIAATMSIEAGQEPDLGFAAGSAPIEAQGLWVLPTTKNAAAVLQLANSTAKDAQVVVTTANEPGVDPEIKLVDVRAGASVLVELAKRDIIVLQLSTSDEGVHAAVSVTRQLGGLAGVTVVPLNPGENGEAPAKITLDPHVGS
ncbi:MAG: DUF5719 family protein [Propionibacteriaceae bacterium]|jgi:hypothetical protein|nr:DUF5719 family protein [Propionibacteriaceae bacterium]